MNDVGRKAADHIHEHPQDWVVALPDLYPMSVFNGTPNEHRSLEELGRLLWQRYSSRAEKLGMTAASRTRFRIHCLKYDLEVLLLATPDALRARLGTSDLLRDRWRLPVEDQNDNHPPRRIIEALFAKYREKPGYVASVDAPWILKRTPLEGIVAACPQRFAPFVAEILILANGEAPP